MNLREKISTVFQKRFNEAPAFIVRAPGRVNLIGEHTDYNDGFALPMTINRSVWIALRPRNDKKVSLKSLNLPNSAEFSLNKIAHGKNWDEYPRGVAWVLQRADYPLQGWEGILASDIPVGAGLSSSAALELAIARAFWAVNRWDWNPTKMALLAQKTENDGMGLETGIMDQMVSSNGKKESALLIDCRSLDFNLLPLPKQITVAILDTATRRGLVDSAYNERVTQCQKASNFFGVDALRDISPEKFKKQAKKLDPLIRRRAKHVITENVRTLQAAEAMRAGDANKLGQLINESHLSLRDDYEVSSKELNTMVEIANTQTGCLGARMTGGGFGGCAVALVKNSATPSFSTEVAATYQKKTGLKAQIYLCHPTNGAELVDEKAEG